VLFGSDYPLITPDRWIADLEQTEIRPELYEQILKRNAAKVLGL
jgi:predicted TIM-barrel fold metal-dependent hydrolase